MIPNVLFGVAIALTMIPSVGIFTGKKRQAPDPNKTLAWAILTTLWYIDSAVSHYIGLP